MNIKREIYIFKNVLVKHNPFRKAVILMSSDIVDYNLSKSLYSGIGLSHIRRGGGLANSQRKMHCRL